MFNLVLYFLFYIQMGRVYVIEATKGNKIKVSVNIKISQNNGG